MATENDFTSRDGLFQAAHCLLGSVLTYVPSLSLSLSIRLGAE